MKANELRIGNLIINQYNKIKAVDFEDFKWHFDNEQGFTNNWSFFNPIPLTEEWLVKFGFEKDDDDNFELLDVLIQSWRFCSEFHYVNNHGCSDINILYVHQLQNLYFALTNTELTIK
jgi:hypothetical protein